MPSMGINMASFTGKAAVTGETVATAGDASGAGQIADGTREASSKARVF